ncbi:MAG: hypothetical protein AAFN51_10925 [Pseudomonadota bacterium]
MSGSSCNRTCTTGSATGAGSAANPSGRHSDPHGNDDIAAQDQSEFLKSLKLARAALYARDPKRRAIEAIELQANARTSRRL